MVACSATFPLWDCATVAAKATRFYQPNDGDDRMNENDEDVVHAGIVSNLKNP
jgi:hypothetical protein